jgi:hypothetical protein
MSTHVVVAIVASFAVYLIPILDPPSFTCWGCQLLDLLGGRRRPLDPLELGLFLAVSVLLQAALGLTVWWLARRPGWLRGLLLPVVWIALIPAAYSFPNVFATIGPWLDRDTTAEKMDWPLECAVPGSLATTRPLPGNPLGAAGEAVIRRKQQVVLLGMPGCAVRALAIPMDRLGIVAPLVLPGGVALYETSRDNQWWLLRGPGSDPVKLDRPPKSGNPILSSDGRWIAWPVQAFGAMPSVVIRRLDGAEEHVVSPAIRNPLAVEVLALDMERRTIVFSDVAEGFRSTTLDGSTRWGPVYPNAGHVEGTTLLMEDVGWLVPHVARAGDAWFLPWAAAGPRVNLGLRRGQTLQAIAIDPAGKLLALSAEAADRTTVVVLQITDQQIVFRRHLPRLNFAPVTFLGDRYFAYSEPGQVRVLRLP